MLGLDQMLALITDEISADRDRMVNHFVLVVHSVGENAEEEGSHYHYVSSAEMPSHARIGLVLTYLDYLRGIGRSDDE